MAQVGDLTLASEITSLYTRLNAARKNHHLRTLSRTISKDTPTASNQMTVLESDLNATAKDSIYIKTKTYDLGEIGIGDPTKYIAVSTASSAIKAFEDTCVHNNHDGDDSDDTAVAKCTDNSHESVQSDHSDCDFDCSWTQ